MVYLEIEKLFDAFLKEKQFLCGASPATVRIYSKSWAAYKRYVGRTCELTGDRLESLTLHASQEIKPGSVNAYARGVNSFLTSLFENGHVAARMRVPLTSVENRVLCPTGGSSMWFKLNALPITDEKIGNVFQRDDLHADSEPIETPCAENIHAAAISGVIRQLDSEGDGSRRNQPQSIFKKGKHKT